MSQLDWIMQQTIFLLQFNLQWTVTVECRMLNAERWNLIENQNLIKCNERYIIMFNRHENNNHEYN